MMRLLFKSCLMALSGFVAGTAMAYPTAAAMKRAGNRVITILGGRNKDLVILGNGVRHASQDVTRACPEAVRHATARLRPAR